MTDATWLVAACLLSVAGMSWMALGMAVHWQQAMPAAGPLTAASRRLLRGLGAGALLLSLACCLQADHPSMAVLVWLMLAAMAIVLVTSALAWRPVTLRWLWPGTMVPFAGLRWPRAWPRRGGGFRR